MIIDSPLPCSREPLRWRRWIQVSVAGALFGIQSVAVPVYGQEIISTVVGSDVPGFSGDGGPASNALLRLANFAGGVGVDAVGNLYIADTGNHRIRKIDPQGTITTVAGNGVRSFSGDRNAATGASLNTPGGVALDETGNLYIADTENHRIRKVNSKGIITTVAGNGIAGFSGDGGPADATSLSSPASVAADGLGNLYIADTGNRRIRRVNSEGIVTTVLSSMNDYYGVATDQANNLYVADSSGGRILKISPGGALTTVAGGGTSHPGYGDGGPATSAWLNYPTGVALDFAGNLYIADSHLQRIRKVFPSGTITTVAGSGLADEVEGVVPGGFSGDGGPASQASLNFPWAVATDANGSVYIVDSLNNRVRKVSTTSVTFFVPIILSGSGLNNSFFTSELTLTNRSAKDANLELTYAAAFGGGSGTASTTLASGSQLVVPDAITYLKSLGIPLPDSGNRGGTLTVHFSGIVSALEAAVAARTTTTVAGGRAGLAYPGVPISNTLDGPSYLCGLRQNYTDRSSVAVQHAGQPSEGDIALRVTVFSGYPAAPQSQVLPDIILPPGGFKQISLILHSNGLSLNNGYIKVERVRGTSPYYAYGIINDQPSSDGSFVPPILESSLTGRAGLALPVVVKTNSFATELILTNWSGSKKRVYFDFVSQIGSDPDFTSRAAFSIELNVSEQLILPDFVQWLRYRGVVGSDGGRGRTGSLFATFGSQDASGIFLGARTVTQALNGRYGLFYAAVPYGMANSRSSWLYGLQQNAENRTNLALVNTGEADSGTDLFTIELFDGDTGLKVNTIEEFAVPAKGWRQIDSILAQHAPGITHGYARVIRTAGRNPFISYAVISDGGKPGERSDDGAFVSSWP